MLLILHKKDLFLFQNMVLSLEVRQIDCGSFMSSRTVSLCIGNVGAEQQHLQLTIIPVRIHDSKGFA
jgi:hypothetical protein